MSIFKEPFKDSIKNQISKRQEVMTSRTPQGLQYLNSRNSWIRMSSAVDVLKSTVTNPTIDQLKDPANYDNTLAKKYILQGGTLNENGTLKSGMGADFSNAYSRKSAEGIDYRLGIRPMPGITNIDVKSKGAYGSLREVTVSFQCWDIHQLEDLELLYMRPGYTVLVEWGWSPYFDENGNYKTTVEFYDIVDAKKDKETIWKELDEKMAKNGNYEAMFGYVKNYSWNARMDGGYDCSTNIISLGEVVESLKTNYIPSAAMPSIEKNGYLLPNIKSDVAVSISDYDEEDLKEAYSQNILAGLFYELYTMGIKQDPGTEDAGKSYYLSDTKYGSQYNLFRKTININGEDDKSDDKKIGESDEQLYVTLESLCDLLNNYVLLKDGGSTADPKPPFTKITVRDPNYSGSVDSSSGDGYLLALAHPLQVSVDPRVCLIKNMLWAKGINVNLSTDDGSGSSLNNQSPLSQSLTPVSGSNPPSGSNPISGSNPPQTPIPPSKTPTPPSSTTSVDAILIGGLDTRKGDYNITQQVELFKKGFGNKNVKGFRYNTKTTTILDFIKQNPKVPIVMFSAGCSKADSIATSPDIDKNKVYIVECYAVNGNNQVVNAVKNGIPASHVYVGPSTARGSKVVNGTSSSDAPSHWDALEIIGKKIK